MAKTKVLVAGTYYELDLGLTEKEPKEIKPARRSRKSQAKMEESTSISEEQS